MAKLSASSSGGKQGRTACLAAFGILVVVGVIVGLTSPTANGGSSPIANLFAQAQCTEPCVPGSEDIMNPKAHGTSEYPVVSTETKMGLSRWNLEYSVCLTLSPSFVVRSLQQENLLWGCDVELADRICNFNRHYAEFSGYWLSTSFLTDVEQNIEDGTPLTFYDSGWKGSPLFTAPRDRSWEDFITESTKHGWPSFRDSEVDWDYARVLPGGEMVSIDGTHLGHNLPDSKGNRYCISKYRNRCMV